MSGNSDRAIGSGNSLGNARNVASLVPEMLAWAPSYAAGLGWMRFRTPFGIFDRHSAPRHPPRAGPWADRGRCTGLHHRLPPVLGIAPQSVYRAAAREAARAAEWARLLPR